MVEKRVKKSPRSGKEKLPANGRANTRRRKEPKIVYEAGFRPPATFRGLMPTPPEVQKIVDDLYRERPFSESFRREQTDSLNEQYYFGGNWIACRNTPQGREVLAVGWDEIRQLFRKRMTRSERESIVQGYVEPWYFPVPYE